MGAPRGGSTPWRGITAVFAIAAAVRAPLLPLHAYRWGGGTDTSEYKQWMAAIHEHGALEIFRSTNTDYAGYHGVPVAADAGLGANLDRQGSGRVTGIRGSLDSFADVWHICGTWRRSWPAGNWLGR